MRRPNLRPCLSVSDARITDAHMQQTWLLKTDVRGVNAPHKDGKKQKVYTKYIFKKKGEIISLLLKNRGIEGKTASRHFLEPHFTRDLHDPFLMRGMEQVVERIKQAIHNKERIGIFGDYDADGVCGSAILYSVFNRIGLETLVETYLPDRQKQGFGLSISGISYFLRRGVNLVITVDCGITNHKEIMFAKKKGIDVIVTDHHILSQGSPPCVAFLDPKRPDETYPFSDLSGTGVAFKLAQALKKTLRNKKLSEAWEKRLLDLVAIATIADMMPLIDENRTFVSYGLKVIQKGTHREGLRALIEQAGLEKERISAKDIAFQIGPRINATSRIDHAVRALKLFITKNPQEAATLAKGIETLNKRRRTIVDKIVRQIMTRVKAHKAMIRSRRLLFEADREWQPGILSLVSNRMKEEFAYPAIVVSMGKKFSIASCRSHAPFSLISLMEKINTLHPSLLVRWGGHHQAAGFTVRTQDLVKTRVAFEQALKSSTFLNTKKELEIDCEVDVSVISSEFANAIQKLAPFGKGNPEPIFLLRNVHVKDIKKVGAREAHFRIFLEKEKIMHEAIFFNGVKEHHIKKGDIIDVVFMLKMQYWRGKNLPELHIIDLAPSLA